VRNLARQAKWVGDDLPQCLKLEFRRTERNYIKKRNELKGYEAAHHFTGLCVNGKRHVQLDLAVQQHRRYLTALQQLLTRQKAQAVST